MAFTGLVINTDVNNCLDYIKNGYTNVNGCLPFFVTFFGIFCSLCNNGILKLSSDHGYSMFVNVEITDFHIVCNSQIHSNILYGVF